MEFIHSREYLNQGDVVEVSSDTPCNFMLTDETNFSSFKRGESFRYYGGFFKNFPARINVPHSGQWNITIDLGAGSGHIRYGLRLIKAQSV